LPNRLPTACRPYRPRHPLATPCHLEGLPNRLPTARRPHRDDEPDEEHESKYLIVAEDIYGDRQSYSPPVIGEHRPSR